MYYFITQRLKEEAEKLQQEFGYCILDGHREKIGNFKTEPPGLFRGRGNHPEMGMLKRKVMLEGVTINCSGCVQATRVRPCSSPGAGGLLPSVLLLRRALRAGREGASPPGGRVCCSLCAVS